MRKITMNKLRQSYKSIFQLDLWTVSLPQMVQGSKLVLNRLFSQKLCFHVLSNISSIFLNKFSDILIQYIYIFVWDSSAVTCILMNLIWFRFPILQNMFFASPQISNFTKHVFLRHLRAAREFLSSVQTVNFATQRYFSSIRGIITYNYWQWKIQIILLNVLLMMRYLSL